MTRKGRGRLCLAKGTIETLGSDGAKFHRDVRARVLADKYRAR
jgi:hypothetical protein